MLYKIHNLTPQDLLSFTEDESFIHVSNVTKDILLKSEDIILFSRKTLVMVENQIKIINFEKSSLIHELNLKYQEYFPESIITVSNSKQEEDNFLFKVPSGSESMRIEDNSKLKITVKNKSVEFLTISEKLCYNQPELCLSRFYKDKINYTALELEVKNNQYDILQAQSIQFNMEKNLLKEFLKN